MVVVCVCVDEVVGCWIVVEIDWYVEFGFVCYVIDVG